MVSNNIKSILTFYLQVILVWILANFFFLFLRNYGTDLNVADNPLKALVFWQRMTLVFSLGTMAGIVYGTVELLFDRPYFQRHSYGRIIISKLILFFFAVKIMMAIALTISATFRGLILEPEEIIFLLRSKMYWVLFIYFLIVAGFISFVRMVSQKFGPGVLWNMFIGRYRNPREEQRVFMFLDLKSSTTIAEKLGHIQFSKLIQNCFADLTPVVLKHKVEIYQYVGDEAVLSWPIEKGFDNNHCIHCYFDYLEVLEAKSDYYEKAYGVRPFFKAGIHMGEVIVAEVGLIKREIAYHGDVLNTTARIQSRCNELQQSLLISDQVRQSLSEDARLQSHYMGEEILKGKKIAVRIFGVSRKNKVAST